MQLILASQSKQRQSFLSQLGVEFTVQPAHVDESSLKHEAPLAYVKRIAIAKATAISEANPGAVVLAADTPVIVGRRIVQTPTTVEEAADMLRLYSGRRVAIPTTLAMADAKGKIHVKVTNNWIKFKRLSEDEIHSYLATRPWNIAGALKIECVEPWVITMHGSVSAMIGLPLYETATLLARAGIATKPFQNTEFQLLTSHP